MATDRPHTVRLHDAGPANTQYLSRQSLNLPSLSPSLSLYNSEIWRATPVIFQWPYSSDLSIVRYEHIPPTCEPSPHRGPWKRKIHQNAPYSTPSCTKFVVGRGPRYTKYFEQSFRLQNPCIMIVLRAYMWPPCRYDEKSAITRPFSFFRMRTVSGAYIT